jgi:hypothetical protein
LSHRLGLFLIRVGKVKTNSLVVKRWPSHIDMYLFNIK